MALLLQLKTKPNHNPFSNPSAFFFSTSSSFSSPFSSYLKDLKHTLKHQQQPPSPPPPQTPSSATFQRQHQKQDLSLDEIRRNLSEFRRRTAAPEQKPNETVSFQELYNRSAHRRPPGPSGDSGSGRGKPQVSLDAIRDGLRKLGAARVGGDRNEADRMSLPAFKEALSLRPSDSSAAAPRKVIGGTSAFPEMVFGREMSKKSERDESAAMAAARREYSRIYSYGELGEKLRKLRPEGKDSFSLEELNQRLIRLREIELEEAESNVQGSVLFKDLRECLIKINETNDEEAKKSSLHKFNILSQLGKTPAYILDPPKEHLVEKYFHPDNMSSAEKLKIELAKVRDEFKMSESDCGSARVQVAQLTTKIKHLSAVLHKKDVHSRKGLLAMVQRRKRLLKYLRRTDWDSYCFVISKLGLRDNPDHSHKTQAKSRFTHATSS